MKLEKNIACKQAPVFSSIKIADKRTGQVICNNINDKDWEIFKTILKNQFSNPIDAIIYTKNNRLRAKIWSKYQLKDFKENYKQIPIFESSISFIKRISKLLNKYKEQISQ